jgi:hypothetical protein
MRSLPKLGLVITGVTPSLERDSEVKWSVWKTDGRPAVVFVSPSLPSCSESFNTGFFLVFIIDPVVGATHIECWLFPIWPIGFNEAISPVLLWSCKDDPSGFDMAGGRELICRS